MPGSTRWRGCGATTWVRVAAVLDRRRGCAASGTCCPPRRGRRRTCRSRPRDRRCAGRRPRRRVASGPSLHDAADDLVAHRQRQHHAAILERHRLAAAEVVVAFPDMQVGVADAAMGDFAAAPRCRSAPASAARSPAAALRSRPRPRRALFPPLRRPDNFTRRVARSSGGKDPLLQPVPRRQAGIPCRSRGRRTAESYPRGTFVAAAATRPGLAVTRLSAVELTHHEIDVHANDLWLRHVHLDEVVMSPVAPDHEAARRCRSTRLGTARKCVRFADAVASEGAFANAPSLISVRPAFVREHWLVNTRTGGCQAAR